MPLPTDATLADVVGKLKHPKTYFLPLIEKLKDCASVNGAAYVRIGITGDGSSPYYLITADADGQKIFGAFDYGHKFESDPDDEKWSTAAMGIHPAIALAAPFLIDAV